MRLSCSSALTFARTANRLVSEIVQIGSSMALSDQALLTVTSLGQQAR